jgi:uncharacterized protein
MIIAIRDLKEGINEFVKVVPSAGYDLKESQFYPNPIELSLYIDKLENLFRVKVLIQTEATYICDRCLDPFPRHFEETVEQIYHLGPSELQDDGIEIIAENSKEIDISKAIEEAFLLSRPIQLLCGENCKGLCVTCGINLNNQTCNCDQNQIDPRLEKLKSLLK